MQIVYLGDSLHEESKLGLHEVSEPVFWEKKEKKKKNIISLLSAEFAQSDKG